MLSPLIKLIEPYFVTLSTHIENTHLRGPYIPSHQDPQNAEVTPWGSCTLIMPLPLTVAAPVTLTLTSAAVIPALPLPVVVPVTAPVRFTLARPLPGVQRWGGKRIAVAELLPQNGQLVANVEPT